MSRTAMLAPFEAGRKSFILNLLSICRPLCGLSWISLIYSVPHESAVSLRAKTSSEIGTFAQMQKELRWTDQIFRSGGISLSCNIKQKCDSHSTFCIPPVYIYMYIYIYIWIYIKTFLKLSKFRSMRCLLKNSGLNFPAKEKVSIKSWHETRGFQMPTPVWQFRII